jgi:hypothetical protein
MPVNLGLRRGAFILDLLNPDLIPQTGHQPGRRHQRLLGRVSKSVGPQPGSCVINRRRRPFWPIGRGLGPGRPRGVRIFHHRVWEPDRGNHSDPRRKRQVTGYKKDKNGQTVLSKMDEGALKKSRQKRGAYFPASQGEVEVSKIHRRNRPHGKKDLDSRVYGQGENHYRWPLFLAILLLLFEFFGQKCNAIGAGFWTRLGRVGRFLALAGGCLLHFRAGPGVGALSSVQRNRALGSKGPKNPDAQFNLGKPYIEQSYAAAAEALKKPPPRSPIPLEIRRPLQRGQRLLPSREIGRRH